MLMISVIALAQRKISLRYKITIINKLWSLIKIHRVQDGCFVHVFFYQKCYES